MSRFGYGQGNGRAIWKARRFNRRVVEHARETDERDMGVRADAAKLGLDEHDPKACDVFGCAQCLEVQR
jgi:hypothetical protein